MSHIACFCAGAIVALLFALWMMTRRKPPGITKHARKPVDVPHRRQWRDAPERRDGTKPCIACRGGDFPCVCRRDQKPAEPIYMYGVTGLEND